MSRRRRCGRPTVPESASRRCMAVAATAPCQREAAAICRSTPVLRQQWRRSCASHCTRAGGGCRTQQESASEGLILEDRLSIHQATRACGADPHLPSITLRARSLRWACERSALGLFETSNASCGSRSQPGSLRAMRPLNGTMVTVMFAAASDLEMHEFVASPSDPAASHAFDPGNKPA